MQIESVFDDKQVQKRLQALIKLGTDMTPITAAISAVLMSESEDAFANEADPMTGAKWAPLSEAYQARLEKKGYTGTMLQRTQGGLAMSLQQDFDAVSAAIGTNKIYAAIHMWGGLPSMPAAPAAVPARGYMGLSEGGIKQIHEIINQKHQEALNR